MHRLSRPGPRMPLNFITLDLGLFDFCGVDSASSRHVVRQVLPLSQRFCGTGDHTHRKSLQSRQGDRQAISFIGLPLKIREEVQGLPSGLWLYSTNKRSNPQAAEIAETRMGECVFFLFLGLRHSACLYTPIVLKSSRGAQVMPMAYIGFV